jgi:hypothetical protein
LVPIEIAACDPLCHTRTIELPAGIGRTWSTGCANCAFGLHGGVGGVGQCATHMQSKHARRTLTIDSQRVRSFQFAGPSTTSF